MPEMCPRLVWCRSTAPIPKPPKNGVGHGPPCDGTLIVALPIAIATTLQTINHQGHLGTKLNEAGAHGSERASIAEQ